MRWNFTGSEVLMASASRSFDSNTTDADAGVQNDHARMAHASKPRAHLFITPPWPIPRPASRLCRDVLPARDHDPRHHPDGPVHSVAPVPRASRSCSKIGKAHV